MSPVAAGDHWQEELAVGAAALEMDSRSLQEVLRKKNTGNGLDLERKRHRLLVSGTDSQWQCRAGTTTEQRWSPLPQVSSKPCQRNRTIVPWGGMDSRGRAGKQAKADQGARCLPLSRGGISPEGTGGTMRDRE